MNSISVSEAKELFYSSDAVYAAQEQPIGDYHCFSGDAELLAYTSHGCLAVHIAAGWHVHMLSRDADILAAIDEVKAIGDEGYLHAITLGDPPPEIADLDGKYRLTARYKPYSDPDIRMLTAADADIIERCCAVEPDDSGIAHKVAGEFLARFHNSPESIEDSAIGLIVGGELAGFVTGDRHEAIGNAEPTVLINLFVSRPYRRAGAATRLISALNARWEDTRYLYSCEKDNKGSLKTALRCGYEPIGEYLVVRE